MRQEPAVQVAPDRSGPLAVQGAGPDWDCDLMTYTFIDVKRWQARAEEMRIMAKQMDNAEAREIMLRLAADYERLAEWAVHELAR